jgi:RHH-type transcriptional regulator, rel operon repressor / antitoxin RelB
MPLSLRLRPETLSRPEKLARQTGRSKTFYATQAIEEHIEDLEDYFLAESRLKDIESGKAHAVSLKALMKNHDLAD